MQGIYNFFSNCPSPIQAAAFATPIVSTALMTLHASLYDEYKNTNSSQALNFCENAPKFLKFSEVGLSTQTVCCVALAILFGQPEIFLGFAFFAGLCLLAVKGTDLDNLKHRAVGMRMDQFLKDNEARVQEWLQRSRNSLVEQK